MMRKMSFILFFLFITINKMQDCNQPSYIFASLGKFFKSTLLENVGVDMVLILHGNSLHVAHASRKMGRFG